MLEPVMTVRYERMTLVSKESPERMTIDYGLRFESADRKAEAPKDFIIVETKSRHGRGAADSIMKESRIRPVKKCSKFCIGMNLLSKTQRANNFRPVLALLEKARLCENSSSPQNTPHPS